MQKLFIAALSFTLPLFAMDLSIKPDTNVSVSQNEVNQMIVNFKKKRMTMESSDAKAAVLDNRLLANAFIKNSLPEIKDELLTDLKLAIEENFAEQYVKRMQQNVDVKDEVIASYYYTNRKDFLNPVVNATIYSFKSFEDANLFYEKSRSNVSKIASLSQDFNATKVEQTMELSKISANIKPLLKDVNQSNYLTQPLFLNNQNVVIYINNIKNEYLSLDESKDKIKTLLLQKIFSSTRENLLKDLKK